MNWFTRWWRGEPDIADDHHGPLKERESGDWIVLPYRLAEACRISMGTVGAHPDLPDHIKLWIDAWMVEYNISLASYFQENYGSDVFPVLEEITNRVWRVSEKYYTAQQLEEMAQSFQEWEQQLEGGGNGDGTNT